MRNKWRKSNEKFSRPPSMETVELVKICPVKLCGQFLVRTDGQFPTVCPRCGADATGDSRLRRPSW